jgi:cell division GTPase FtsZ
VKLALIGLGNAGGKIVDELIRHEAELSRSVVESAVAINTARVDLARLDQLPRENRFLVGQTHEQVKGHGAGGDPDLGASVIRSDRAEIDRALDRVPPYEVDAFWIVAGLGGGTGSGGAPVVAEQVAARYDPPVYGLGVLPSESEGGRAALNAARSLRSFADAADNLVLFDNAAWQANDDSLEAGYARANREVSTRIMRLLSAGTVDGSTLSENAMDASDINRTLSSGGVSTIAYAETADPSAEGRGLLSRLAGSSDADTDDTDAATIVSGLIREAVNSRLTCPAAVDTAERALIVLSGSPSSLSRKGLEAGRRWVESEIESAEVLAGDDPRESADVLSAVVLLSTVTDVPRVEALQAQAVEAKETIEEQASLRESATADLITDDDDQLDPV